jgi:hypothetical protein
MVSSPPLAGVGNDSDFGVPQRSTATSDAKVSESLMQWNVSAEPKLFRLFRDTRGCDGSQHGSPA